MISTSYSQDRAPGDFCLELSEEVCSEIPATRLAITYVLLVPLVLFAVHGGFSFEHSSWNSDLGAFGGKMAVVTTDAEAMRDRVQTAVGLTFCLAAMAAYVRSLVGFMQTMPLMVLLPLYAMSSALWSQGAGTSLRSGFSLLVTTFFAFYLAERFSERQQMEVLTLVGACVGLGSVIVAVGWPQFGVDHQLHEGAWQGLFTQKNACSEATLFLLTPALALPAIGRYGQILRALYIVLCLSIILMTQSRTGWAIALIYFGFAGSLRVLRRFGRKDLLPLTALIFGSAGAVIVALLADPLLVLSLIGRSGSFSGRAQIWKAIVASIFRRPLGGYGFDAFWSMLSGEATRVFSATGWVVTSAHSGFLNVALELGLVGLALLALTFVQACRHATAAFRPGHSEYVDWCIGIVFLTIIYNLDERTLMAPQYLPWILYIVACVGLRKAAFREDLAGVTDRAVEVTP
jgi:exopolysaccharide production protein ExoQ